MKLIAHQIKNSLRLLLHNNSNGLFSVTGFRKINFDEQEAMTPIVSVLVDEGEFPDDGKGTYNVFPHECIIKIQVIASEKYGIDLNIINDPNATASQLQNAIMAGTLAAENAEDKILETIGTLFSIINNVHNRQLGFLPITTKPIDKKKFKKYKIMNGLENGSYVTLKAEIILEIKVTEMVDSAVSVSADNPALYGKVEGHSDSEQTEHGNMFVNT